MMIFTDDTGACSCSERTTLSLGWPALFLLIIVLVSLVGNSAVCIVIGRYKLAQNGGFNAFIISIAVCDLLTTCILMPISITRAYDPTVTSPWLCDLWLYVDLILAAVVAAHLISITADHCLTINSPSWHKRLSNSNKANLFKIGLTWLIGLLVMVPLIVWEHAKTPENASIPEMNMTSTKNNITVGFGGHANCDWKSPEFVFVTSVVCIVVPFILCVMCYAVLWCRLKRALSMVFKRPHTGNADRTIEETLLVGSAKLNGHKSEGGSFTQKLTASLRRGGSVSGSRRSKRDSMQHRSSAMDRHPSLRYSIKRQPGSKSDNPDSAKSSIRRSRKSSPNPPHSSLQSDHQALVSKLSWNSAVSDLDQPRSVSPAFLENTPTCHSIADLISTHSSSDIKKSSQSEQGQSSSYCNLFVEQSRRGERGNNSPANLSIQEDKVEESSSLVINSSDPGQKHFSFSSDDVSKSTNETTQGDGPMSQTRSDNSKLAEVEGPKTLMPKGSDPIINTDEPDKVSNTNKDDILKGDGSHLNPLCADNKPQDVIDPSQPDTTDNELKSKERLYHEKTASNKPSSINKNLLSTDYHYEPLAVTEEPSKSHPERAKKDSQSPRRSTKVSVQDLRYMSITLGVLLLIYFLTSMPFFAVYFGRIWCLDCGMVAPASITFAMEWLMFVGTMGKPFIYVVFHMNFRTALLECLNMNT